jgi:hypothetical protein
MKNSIFSPSMGIYSRIQMNQQFFQNKILSQKVFLVFFAFLTSISFQSVSQTVMENHHTKITEINTMIMEKAMAITDGSISAKAEKQKHTREIGSHIMDAKKHLMEMEKEMPEHKMMCATMKMHYNNAMRHQKILKSELSKSMPVEKKVREHATKVHEIILKNENEHKTLMEKMK